MKARSKKEIEDAARQADADIATRYLRWEEHRGRDH